MIESSRAELIESSRAELTEQVRSHYAAAARVILAGADGSSCCVAEEPSAAADGAGRHDTGPCCASTPAAGAADAAETAECFGQLYNLSETAGLPQEALLASLGCGNPLAVAELRTGERVLDLGSGGGIYVLLSARRVGPSGFAYGVDMTDDMLELARKNAAAANGAAGAANVEFRRGQIEDLPLPDNAVDVVISNCVINLSADKPAVLREMFRVLVPGGRIGIADVVADDRLSPADRQAAGSYVGCIAGALSRSEYLDGLASAGFADASVTLTSEAVPGMYSAIVRAVKPVSS